MSGDTIAAIATPPGRGGIGVVRISGPACGRVAEVLLGGLPAPRKAVLRHFKTADGHVLDHGLALYFPAPASFTGEDVLELHGHGGPVVMDALLERVLDLGARLARPGEFSERAFLNDKLDLAQAEAVADLIDASSRQAARAAIESLQGGFSARVTALVEGLIELRIYVESAIDFPEEEIDFLADASIHQRLSALQRELTGILASAAQGRLLREGMTVVIAGQPNAGKSSLLNRLVDREAAIVTAIPGTTRDLLREYIQLDGMPLHVVDTAGLRDSPDEVEREGIRRARDELAGADRILLVVDDTAGITAADEALLADLPGQPAITWIRNKIDISGRCAGLDETGRGVEIALSAHTGEGLEVLKGHLKHFMGFQSTVEGQFMARRRHLDALTRSRDCLARGGEHLAAGAGELLAEELRTAQQCLGEITGEFTADDLLGRIFASFCIGK